MFNNGLICPAKVRFILNSREWLTPGLVGMDAKLRKAKKLIFRISSHGDPDDKRLWEVAGAEGLEPPTVGFGDRCSTNWNYAPAIGGHYTGLVGKVKPLLAQKLPKR